MSLPNYLAKIKSSGIYRFVWDKSEVSGVPAETLRLVVGYSEKGPFNTPTYIQSASEFIQIYGNINKKLERRGIYFHRLALQALTAGPILALNLKKFENEKVQAISMTPADTILNLEGTEINIKELGIEDVYDTNRFWVLDANKMQSNEKMDKYISIAATDSRECSNTIFVRGAKVNGYNLSVSEWYSSATTDDMPSYFEGYESLKIEDFFAEVYVFRGQFTKEIASSNELSKYFDINGDTVTVKRYLKNAFGEKVDGLEALSQNENANFVKRYEGILLPNFKDSQNNYISLDLLFNSDNYEHKMLMDFNIEMLENGDITVDTLQTSGYNNEKLDDTLIDNLVSALENGTDYESVESQISIFNNLTIVPEITLVTGYNDGKWEYKNSDYVVEPHLYVYDVDINNLTSNKFNSMGIVVGDRFLGKNNKVSTLTAVEEITTTSTEYVQPEELVKNETPETTKFIYSKSDFVLNQPNPIKFGVEVKEEDKSKNVIVVISNVDDVKVLYKDWTGSYVEPIKYNGNYYFGGHGQMLAGFSLTNTVDIDFQVIPTTSKVNIEFDLVEVSNAMFSEPYTYETIEKYSTEVLANTVVTSDSISENNISNLVKLVFDTPVRDGKLTKCNRSLSSDNSKLVPVYLKGYEYGKSFDENGDYIKDPITGKVIDNSKPKDGTQRSKLDWQNFILSALTDYRGIRTALTSRQDVEYRYIVDTFEGFVDSECKSKIAIIAKEKDNAMAFLNFPSVYNFTNCEYTSFTDENNRFQVKYIKDGGNKIKNPSVLFSLVSEANGASYVSYNTPLTFTDGTVKTYVPSAALVSNNFMQKYTSRQPYYIVAGPNYGRMIFDGCVGPDYNYSRADLDILEPMGVNCMVYVPRKGTYINSNQTAKQNPVTALSKINVRELVIFLQDEIEALLQNYQWEFNTQALRDTVKAKADVICENVRANGGIYAFVNRCDSSNNTNDVIDNEMFVLSTEIEPSRGAGKMVQELTIHKTGGLTSTIK